MPQVLRVDLFDAVVAAVGPRRAAELAAEFAGRLDALLEAARSGAEAAEALIARTHQLRGSAATLGMLALGAELERLERAIARGEGAWRDGRSGPAARVRRAHQAAARAATSALTGKAGAHAGGRTSR